MTDRDFQSGQSSGMLLGLLGGIFLAVPIGQALNQYKRRQDDEQRDTRERLERQAAGLAVLAERAGISPGEMAELIAKTESQIYEPRPMPVVIVSDNRNPIAQTIEEVSNGTTS